MMCETETSLCFKKILALPLKETILVSETAIIASAIKPFTTLHQITLTFCLLVGLKQADDLQCFQPY